MNASAVAGAVFFLLVTALLGWHARKIWVDPGYANRITAQGPIGAAVVRRKHWPGVVRAAVPMAVAIGLMAPATFALGAAGPVRPGHRTPPPGWPRPAWPVSSCASAVV